MMTNLDRLDFRDPAGSGPADSAIEAWIVSAITGSSNKARLRRRLDAISTDTALLRFLHRFLLFNDALAARVPFVAGLIHLTPNVFLDPEGGVAFCQQVNGRVAAYVAEAASDEYRMIDGQNSVHQHLSQIFFNGVLAYYAVDRSSFDSNNPYPPILGEILKEAREKFLVERNSEMIFRALGFHVGLEFFADQEFNLVDSYLRGRHPGLVAALEHDPGTGSDYVWLALHTVVEIGHYRAGMEALNTALRYYRHPQEVPKMAERIKEGFNAFIDLQSRYYDAILCDVA
jgi:hypothetical protein